MFLCFLEMTVSKAGKKEHPLVPRAHAAPSFFSSTALPLGEVLN